MRATMLMPQNCPGQIGKGEVAKCAVQGPPLLLHQLLVYPLHSGELGATQADIDYEALIKAVDEMEPTQFASVDMDKLVAQYTRAR